MEQCIHSFSLMKNNPFESKELPEHESGDVIPIYSGYEVPSFPPLFPTISFSSSVSFTILLFLKSAFCNLKLNSS